MSNEGVKIKASGYYTERGGGKWGEGRRAWKEKEEINKEERERGEVEVVTDGAATGQLAELVHPVKHRVILSYID